MRPVVSRIGRLVTSVLFERRDGIQTAGIIQLEELGLAAEHRGFYGPSGWLNLRRILPRREVSAHDVFVDFGSGMGRVVLQAARYPFRRVIGVELSCELHGIAQENIRRTRRRLRCRDVELVHADVLEYQVPDDVTVAYFYNPFTGEIFAEIIRRLVASVERNPREVRIIYAYPTEVETLVGAGARLVKEVDEKLLTNSVQMYVLGPATPAP